MRERERERQREREKEKDQRTDEAKRIQADQPLLTVPEEEDLGPNRSSQLSARRGRTEWTKSIGVEKQKKNLIPKNLQILSFAYFYQIFPDFEFWRNCHV